MNSEKVEVPENIKKKANESVRAIIKFVITYILLMLSAIGLTVLCTYWGIRILQKGSLFDNLTLGVGLIVFSLFILFFLVKFIFKSSKTDDSYYYEITENDEPKLFNVLNEVAYKLQTSLPTKVYLTPDVSVGIFYSSNLWSIFFSRKKNLFIGMGLLNTVSVIEFKGIIAQEFAQFSQQNMSIGTFAQNVNRVLKNLLYDNESYEAAIDYISSIHDSLSFITDIVAWTIGRIQWVLHKVYEDVNTAHLELTVEMKFHADAIAADFVGSEPIINSCMRFQMSSTCLEMVTDYYNQKTVHTEITNDIFAKQFILMDAMAREHNLSIVNSLPEVTMDFKQTLSKSKLTIIDPWSGQPEIIDRIIALDILNKPTKEINKNIAISLLHNRQKTSEQLTKTIFPHVNFAEKRMEADDESFIPDLSINGVEDIYPKIYKGYYNFREPLSNKLPKNFHDKPFVTATSLEELFDEKTRSVLDYITRLNADLKTLTQIYTCTISAPLFIYDGQKYTDADCKNLIMELEEELWELDNYIKHKDKEVFKFFLLAAQKRDQLQHFEEKYRSYKVNLEKNDFIISTVTTHSDTMDFAKAETPHEYAIDNLTAAREIEERFKTLVQKIFSDPVHLEEMNRGMKKNFEAYLAGNYQYIDNGKYIDYEVDSLFKALEDVDKLINIDNIRMKKSLLEFQAELLKEVPDMELN